jgi:hypothetical protein
LTRQSAVARGKAECNINALLEAVSEDRERPGRPQPNQRRNMAALAAPETRYCSR